MTVMSLADQVPVPLLTLYLAVNVRDPAELRPEMTAVALARTTSLPETLKEFASAGATVEAPVTPTLMKAMLPPVLPLAAAVRMTRAFVVPAGRVSVTDGPTVARSTYDVDVVV